MTGVHQAAARLSEAQRSGRPCAPVRDLLPGNSAADGYAVQRVLTQARLATGRLIVGHKIGLTSPAVQSQLGVDQPDFGVLFDDMACPSGGPIDARGLLQPRIEAEIAFVLGADLTGPVITERDARAAVAWMSPALEIVDSRIANWDITLVDTVADNASSGRYVLGTDQLTLGDRDLRPMRMAMTDDVTGVCSTGLGAACLGDPITALTWLAATLAGMGTPLRAGHIVLSGALGPMVPVVPGRTYTATLYGLGTVRAAFTQGEP